jgi:predicted MFS family arabinose efflux permease
MSSSKAGEPPLPPLTRGQWLLLFVLAAVQFTHVVDFMIVMPLATYLEEPPIACDTQHFGLIVSVYGFAAAVAGLALAPLLDRFDRKHTLLVLYAGFTLSTLYCALAPGYWSLVLARLLTGTFGGVAASTVLTVIGDAFPPHRRGTAMGTVMSSFSVASIAGVPAGLFLANAFPGGWRVPFLVLGLASAAVLGVAVWVMPSVRGHLGGAHEEGRFWQVLSRPAHLSAYVLMVALVLSTFMIVPFIAAFLEKNLGRSKDEVPLIYLCGGLATLVTTNLFGRLSDRFARLALFRVLALLAMAAILLLVNLPGGTSLGTILLVTTMLWVLTSGRMVPAMAMITSSAEPRYRGSFLSVNASVQQMAVGLAPLLAAAIMGDTKPGEPLVGFGWVGLACAVAGVASVVLAGRLRPMRPEAEASGAPAATAAPAATEAA